MTVVMTAATMIVMVAMVFMSSMTMVILATLRPTTLRCRNKR